MKIILFLLLPFIVFAQSFMVSNIPLPKTYIQNLDPYECDETCLFNYIDNDMIFSFLAHSNTKFDNKEQNEMRMLYASVLNLGAQINTDKVKIAMLLPYKRIGKYAASTTNAAFAYLITKRHPFALKSYKIESENVEDIRVALNAIRSDGFTHIIAPMTQKGAANLLSLNPQVDVYFPTINKQDLNTSSPFIHFGAIDYKAQSELLLKEAVSPLVIFSGKSLTGRKLLRYEKDAFINNSVEDNTLHSQDEPSPFDMFSETQSIPTKVHNLDKKVITYIVSRRTSNIEHYLSDNKKVLYGSYMINTPIVKTGMIMSQITLYDVNATNILSTQINYDPLILSMTQYNDRKNMIIANSITQNNNVLIETNALIGNDIVYDWINYATTIGVDYFFSAITNEERLYQLPIEENQIVYTTELIRPSLTRFVPYIHVDWQAKQDLQMQKAQEGLKKERE